MAKQHTQKKRRGSFEPVELTAPANPTSRKSKSRELHAKEHWQRSSARPLACQTAAQENYLKCIKDNELTFGIGPAGTGKTYVSVKYGAQQIDAGEYSSLIILRPIVEAGGGLGFLPGEVADKIAPWREPFDRVLRLHYGDSQLEAKYNGAHPSIEFIPLEHIRGRTFDNAYVILDEAQNTTPLQMKTLLTRIGQNSKLVINGDVDQVDIKGKSGLTDALEKLPGLESVAFAMFEEADIVRSGLVKRILTRYRNVDNALIAAASGVKTASRG